MPAWLDSSGHLINAAGDRIDDQNRVTKPRGQPGKGYTRRREEAADRERRQTEYINMQATLLQQFAVPAAANTQPPAKAIPQQQPPVKVPPQQQQQQPAASSNQPPPVAQAAATGEGTATATGGGHIYYDNSVTFGDRGTPEIDRSDRHFGGRPYDMGPS